MADGGFLVKFDGKEAARCYAISVDYDMYEYKINNDHSRELPRGLKTITIEVEKAQGEFRGRNT